MNLLLLPILLPFDRWVVPLLALNPDVGQQSDPLERSKNIRLPGRGGGRSFQEESTYQLQFLNERKDGKDLPKETCSVHHHKHQHQHHNANNQHQHEHQHQHRHHDQHQHLLAKMELRDLKTNVLRRRCMVPPAGLRWQTGCESCRENESYMLPNDLDFRFLRCSSCKTFSAKLGAPCYPTCIEEPKTGFRSFSSLGPTCNTCNALMAPCMAKTPQLSLAHAAKCRSISFLYLGHGRHLWRISRQVRLAV